MTSIALRIWSWYCMRYYQVLGFLRNEGPYDLTNEMIVQVPLAFCTCTMIIVTSLTDVMHESHDHMQVCTQHSTACPPLYGHIYNWSTKLIIFSTITLNFKLQLISCINIYLISSFYFHDHCIHVMIIRNKKGHRTWLFCMCWI